MNQPLANDPTALALLDARPVLPVPLFGSSPAIGSLAEERTAHAFLLGSDGLFLYLKRPWLELLAPIAPRPISDIPYGAVGKPKFNMLCGLIPRELAHEAHAYFLDALPNEAGGAILWNETTGDFRFTPCRAVHASPTHLEYQPAAARADEWLIADLHSHGAATPFFSPTDDADDATSTHVSIVFGNLLRSFLEPAAYVARLSAAGATFPVFKSPFSDTGSRLTFCDQPETVSI